MSDFKDRMVDAMDRGVPAEEAYDYVRESMADQADSARKQQKEQGFSVGDRVVWRDDPQHHAWPGYVTSVPADADYVFVKLDVGGTFRVPPKELRRETP